MIIVGLLILSMINIFVEYKKYGIITETERRRYLEKHVDDITPFGVWKKGIYQNNDTFIKYNTVLFLIIEMMFLVSIIIYI